MAKKAEKKTNAMRLLDQAPIPYSLLTYRCDGEHFDGREVARQVGLPCGQVFKTLVTRSERGETVVCCLPVDHRLDLKALAATAGTKRLEMIPIAEILAVTGYIRGGCSPIGMKKRYPTFLDRSALSWPEIAVSAGVRGQQIVLRPQDLIAVTGAVTGVFGAPGE